MWDYPDYKTTLLLGPTLSDSTLLVYLKTPLLQWRKNRSPQLRKNGDKRLRKKAEVTEVDREEGRKLLGSLLVAFASMDNGVGLWDSATGAHHSLEGHSSPVCAVTFSQASSVCIYYALA
jgi:WD40 repeat protein